jgi:hypothetical protein
MSNHRLYIAGRAATCVALPLPSEHLDFWRSLSEQELISMARCLIDSEKNDLPDGIDAPQSVWGDAPWTIISGVDANENVTVVVSDKAGDIEGVGQDVLERHADTGGEPFTPKPGTTYLLYSAFTKAGWFYDLPEAETFDAGRISLGIQSFPDISIDDGTIGLRLIDKVLYGTRELMPEEDFSHDYGTAARLIDF